jgi:hypothetical protein
MNRSRAALILGGVLAAQMLAVGARSAQTANPQPVLAPESASTKLPALPAAPKGKSTIIGGEIQNLDPVRDQFRLKTFGQRPMIILFDERTQVFLDGKKIPLRDLHSNDSGSIQTILDGTNVFALSIHLSSRAPQGEFQGQVLSYNSDTKELTVLAASSRDPLRLLVPVNTPISRVGQAGESSAHAGSPDLVKGSLVSLTFEPNRRGGGIVSQIAILATPGSQFVFGGSISSLDMHAGLLILSDPRDGKSHEVFFDPSKVPTSLTLQEGDNVRVTATFDGTRYVAGAMDAN